MLNELAERHRRRADAGSRRTSACNIITISTRGRDHLIRLDQVLDDLH
ncbi:hypothetical protein [Streptomyces echinatus]